MSENSQPGYGSGLGAFLTDRPVAITMVFLAAVVFGYFSYGRLPITLMPEMSYPTLTVRTEYPGAAPEEVENDISRPLEENLGVIGGLRRISSISRAGLSDVVLEFTWGTTMSSAIQDTLEKLDLVFLPAAAERPLILRFDPSLDPVMELSLAGVGQRYSGDEGLRRLRRIADLQVKRALEPIKGVAAVRVRGGLEEEIEIRLNRQQMLQRGISIDRVINRLESENINLAGGTLDEGRTQYMVRTLNEYTDLSEIADTIVEMRDKIPIRIRDLGTIAWSHKERTITTRTEGSPAVLIEIYKEADANIVSLARRVRDRIITQPLKRGGISFGKPPQQMKPRAQLAEELLNNEGAELKIQSDRSLFIASSVREVRNTAIYGGILAVVVLFLFLGKIRPTAIIAASIPISLLISFAPLNILGVSLNIMSLGGLALGIGMLVDSSIVVLESIFRCLEEGDPLKEAVLRGTAEVRMAVTASTFTSIAVFFPMVFVQGMAGQAFGDLGLAVVISLLASLIVALFLIPMLASRKVSSLRTEPESFRALIPKRSLRWFLQSLRRSSRLRAILLLPYFLLRTILGALLETLFALVMAALLLLLFLGKTIGISVLGRILRFVLTPANKISRLGLDMLNRIYPRSLRWVLDRPLFSIGAMATVLAASIFLLMQLDWELLPKVHQGEISFDITLPVGTPLEKTTEILLPVEEKILSDPGDIAQELLTLGFDPSTSRASDEGENSAKFKLILKHADPESEQRVIKRVRAILRPLPDVEARVVRPVLFSFKTPIEVEIHGDDLIALRRKAEEVSRVMAELPQLADVETSQRSGAPEVQLEYDRDKLARMGLDVSTLAGRVRDAVKGAEATLYNLGDRRVPIVVRYREEDRREVSQIGEFTVNPGQARQVPLSAVARVELAEGPSEVRRIDGRRVALVTANLAQGSLGSAVAALNETLRRDIKWPENMSFFLAGQNEEWNNTRSSLMLALALAIFLVYVIMAMQFESLVQPLVIMLSIPLAAFGAVLALAALKISLSIVVFLGMILLAGIVVNNAIVLIDYINTLRRRGTERKEAIIQAGAVRLRPILMTTATTVLGLLPMALGFGDGAELRSPMAITVIAGLSISTILTLIFIPSIYDLFDRIRESVLSEGKQE